MGGYVRFHTVIHTEWKFTRHLLHVKIYFSLVMKTFHFYTLPIFIWLDIHTEIYYPPNGGYSLGVRKQFSDL